VLTSPAATKPVIPLNSTWHHPPVQLVVSNLVAPGTCLIALKSAPGPARRTTSLLTVTGSAAANPVATADRHAPSAMDFHVGICLSLTLLLQPGASGSRRQRVIPALDDRQHFARTRHSGATHAIAISMGFTGSLWRNLKLGARFLRGAQDPTQDLCAYYRGCRWAGASGTHSRS
jgi:hypothetical protein